MLHMLPLAISFTPSSDVTHTCTQDQDRPRKAHENLHIALYSSKIYLKDGSALPVGCNPTTSSVLHNSLSEQDPSNYIICLRTS